MREDKRELRPERCGGARVGATHLENRHQLLLCVQLYERNKRLPQHTHGDERRYHKEARRCER